MNGNVKVIISLSKGKKSKGKSPRSQFFSELMKELAGDKGDAIAENLVNGNLQEFSDKMRTAVENIVERHKVRGKSH